MNNGLMAKRWIWAVAAMAAITMLRASTGTVFRPCEGGPDEKSAPITAPGGRARQEGDEKDFGPLFNGKDLSGWVGNTNVYWIPEKGVL